MSSSQKWRNSEEWDNAKLEVLIRDNYKCVICGANDTQLNVHHIEDASYHPEKRYELSNLVTLCRGCHTDFHCNFKRSFRQKTTKYDWDNFIMLTNHLKKRFNR